MSTENPVSKKKQNVNTEAENFDQFADQTNFYVPTDVHKRNRSNFFAVGLFSLALLALFILVVLVWTEL